jgi:hypothetical protein
MKRFVASCLAFAALIWALDRLAGAALEHTLARTTTDLRRGMDRHPDVAILGSSRAVYHYAADTLQRRLGASVYNFGRSGQSSPLFHRAMAEMLLAEHPPRLAVLEVDAATLSGPDDLGRLSVLLPYWRHYPAVKEVVLRRSRFERIKLLSRTYSYNSLALNMAWQRLRPQSETRLGFRARHGTAGAGDGEALPVDTGGTGLDRVKARNFACMVTSLRRHGVRVVAVRSPRLLASGADRAEAVATHRLLAGALAGLRVPFVDFAATPAPEFGDPLLFSDRDHLNEEGATRFTRLVADSLRPFLAESGAVPDAPLPARLPPGPSCG